MKLIFNSRKRDFTEYKGEEISKTNYSVIPNWNIGDKVYLIDCSYGFSKTTLNHNNKELCNKIATVIELNSEMYEKTFFNKIYHLDVLIEYTNGVKVYTCSEFLRTPEEAIELNKRREQYYIWHTEWD